MSIQLSDVKYLAEFRHIIIESDRGVVDCATPIPQGQWLNGTYGDTLCVNEDKQYLNFGKAICDTAWIEEDTVETFKFKRDNCGPCGLLNAMGCELGSFSLNITGAGATGEDCPGLNECDLE